MNTPKKLHPLARRCVEHFEPYIPGRSMESVRREYKLKRIVKLASNENSLGPSPKAIAAMRQAQSSLFRYPDGASVNLRQAIADHNRVPVDHVVVGAGSDELIELLGKTYLSSKDSIVISDHAFLRYRMAADLMDAQTISVPMKNWTHDLTAMARAIRPNTKIVFIANPNNPTGTYNTEQELRAFLKQVAPRASNGRLLVVVDEAYLEYARAQASDYPNTLKLQKEFPFLVLLRTFSKLHALAGLRIGYGIGTPSVMDAIDRIRPPFNLNSMAQVAGVASLQDVAHQKKSITLIQRELPLMEKAIQRLGFSTIPSVGNFVLMNVSPWKGQDLFKVLLKKGVIVRAMDEYGFKNHIRVTVGRREENQLFLRTLAALIRKEDR